MMVESIWTAWPGQYDAVAKTTWRGGNMVRGQWVQGNMMQGNMMLHRNREWLWSAKDGDLPRGGWRL